MSDASNFLRFIEKEKPLKPIGNVKNAHLTVLINWYIGLTQILSQGKSSVYMETKSFSTHCKIRQIILSLIQLCLLGITNSRAIQALDNLFIRHFPRAY